MTQDPIDCAIVGGGPAGLTAAIYLARFRLSVRVLDAGGSRCAQIPLSRNHAGFPDGIAGPELLQRMRDQAQLYDVELVDGVCERLERAEVGFRIHGPGEPFAARTVLLATGVINHRPPGIDDALHDEALTRGLIRYCPVCDGYEVTDRKVAVIGTSRRGANEATFLRGFTTDVTLIAPEDAHDLEDAQRAALDEAGIVVRDGPVAGYAIDGERIVVEVGGDRLAFDSLYPALGSNVRSELAETVGADRTEDGCILVDSHQRTEITGLYAAGDVVKGLDQISHAMGEAGVAATTIRNDLAELRPIRR